MTAFNAMAVAGICVLLGLLGFAMRKRFPKIALFSGGVALCGLGHWQVVLTLELAEKGLAQTFSRKLESFSAVAAPDAFARSYWFHLGLGVFLLLAGAYLLVVPFTRRGRRISFKHEVDAKPSSAKGVPKLLGLSFVLFIFIVLWKRFVG